MKWTKGIPSAPQRWYWVRSARGCIEAAYYIGLGRGWWIPRCTRPINTESLLRRGDTIWSEPMTEPPHPIAEQGERGDAR